jgi:lysozyme
MTLDPRFTPALITATQSSHRRFYPYGPFVSITLAQWAIESAYGRAQSGVNNFFGIKANAAQIAAGTYHTVWTKEFLHGQYITIEDRFASYPTLEAGIDAHAQLLVSHHYIPCMRAPTPEAYATALHQCGYATAPNYAPALMSVINANNLKQFDQIFGSQTPPTNISAPANAVT